MGYKARKNMMAILPDGLGYDQRSLRRDLAEDLDAMPLAMNKSMLLDRIVGMAAADRASIPWIASSSASSSLLLRRPARLIG